MIARRSLAPLLLGGLAGRALAQPAGPVLARVRRDKAMRFGVVAGQPPYCWKDPTAAAWVGFIPDIARDLAAEHGAEAVPVESTWGNAVLDVQADKVDVFFGLAPTPQRAQAVSFTHPLYDNAFALVARRGFDPAHWGDLDRPDVRVVLELGTVYDQAAPNLFPRAEVVRLRSNNDALLAVQSGRADCQVLVVVLALTALARNPALGHLLVPEPLHGSPTAAMVAKDTDPAWLAAVDEWVGRRRAAGQIRAALVANLSRVGVAEKDVPGQLLF